MGIYDYSLKKRDWTDFKTADLKGKILIIVNTATGCGFTPQYKGLENLYRKYHEKGLEILDFPCDQFWHQAPGDDEEIHQFCIAKYNTSFDQFSKIEVKGENEASLYSFLKQQQPNEEVIGLKNKIAMKGIKAISTTCKKQGDIVWNFTKFLVNRKWEVIKRYAPTYKPENMENDISSIL